MDFSVVGGWHCSFVTASDVNAARENLRVVSRRRHVSPRVCQCEKNVVHVSGLERAQPTRNRKKEIWCISGGGAYRIPTSTLFL